MRWLRRAKTPSVLTDYRRVSDAVHSRRAEHERDPAALPSNSVEARRAVRSYRPDQRLRGVREHILKYAEHSLDTPRAFGKDSLLPSMESASAQGASLFAGIVMAANGYVIGTILGIIFYLWDKHAGSAEILMVGSIGVAGIALLVVVCVRFYKNVGTQSPDRNWNVATGIAGFLGFCVGLALSLPLFFTA